MPQKHETHPMHVSGKGSGSEACLHAPSVPFGPSLLPFGKDGS